MALHSSCIDRALERRRCAASFLTPCRGTAASQKAGGMKRSSASKLADVCPKQEPSERHLSVGPDSVATAALCSTASTPLSSPGGQLPETLSHAYTSFHAHHADHAGAGAESSVAAELNALEAKTWWLPAMSGAMVAFGSIGYILVCSYGLYWVLQQDKRISDLEGRLDERRGRAQ
eukprot:TRINITY_DN4620_c0_g1_i1.p1 TRINITY_DN4620_c0_g1~~TRINITY_DN4620_c0_g1_i1.p1  ORF type:complete len:176 (-),score=36.40 TRINITY_DN4620_c0_g1_i1:11-538(-)